MKLNEFIIPEDLKSAQSALEKLGEKPDKAYDSYLASMNSRSKK